MLISGLHSLHHNNQAKHTNPDHKQSFNMRLNVLLSILPLVLAAPPQAKRSESAPLHAPETSDLIAGKYIVKFKDASSLSSLDDAMNLLSEAPEHVYTEAFNGFSGSLDEATLEALRQHPDVSNLERLLTITHLTSI